MAQVIDGTGPKTKAVDAAVPTAIRAIFGPGSQGGDHTGQGAKNNPNSNPDNWGNVYSGPSAAQQQVANNLGGITGFNKDTLLGAAKNANTVFDIQDEQNKRLRDTQTVQNKRNAGSDWYTQQQKLQSVTSQLMDAGGNAMGGSNLYDVWDAIARKDDMDDVAVLNNMRSNQNLIDNNYFEALAQSINSRNEYGMGVEQGLRELAADYIAQMNNINPELAKKLIAGNGADGKTLNIPDWLKTNYFEENKKAAATPMDQSWYRPDTAAAKTWSDGLQTNMSNTASASNQDYWTRMNNGYSRRTQ